MTYEIIAKPFPQSRKRSFFLNLRDFLSFTFFRRLPEGSSTAPERWTTAPSKEEVMKIALEILASGQGFESVII